MTTTQETHAFQAETSQLLDLMIHSLYAHREVFLRELLSNASDALDKLRLEALSDESLLGADKRLCIRLEVDREQRILRVIDNGIGMSRAEVIENLGTIARSGTRRYLEALRERASGGGVSQVPDLIGQFGVGFYSGFMVAEEIRVDTWRAGQGGGTRWSSAGRGEYTVEDLEGGARGTSVELRLRPRDADDPTWQDFTDPELLAELVRRYSDFVEYPIEIAAALLPDADPERKSTSEEGLEVVRLNSMKALWARPREEVTAEEHREFYRHLTHGWDEPLETVHLQVEGAASWTALLYLPSERPSELFEGERTRSRLSLYVKRVFIMADCDELLPPWLRFVRGLVDAQDLPLNVSRETLQENRAVARIRERLTKKLLDTLETLLQERREDYVRFWRACGPILKEGIVLDPDKAERIASLSLFESSRGSELTTLDECIARMGEREELWVLAAEDRAKALALPHLEALLARGEEVLFLTDPVDEWVVQRLDRYEEKRLVAVDKGQVELDRGLSKELREEQEREHRGLLERLESLLAPRVAGVRFSARLTDSAAVLVDQAGSVGPHMERMLRHAGRLVPERRRALELNPKHPVVERLIALHGEDPAAPRVAEFAELLLAQAHVAEGSAPPDPKRFAELVNRLLLGS